ncbi:hypothetical protein AK812_SmicGene5390 [Symbiodinium microadriaticum]|uniref:DUF4326 domain-containing protein n=1 Tax=Symbiodinium microadriaticum TaxID=2951 RepID=A0A1Q9ETW5_SYMMI|nr:hypothetical protein AK812_SmicGene5390 [Symbiodinium microadriaticum]
MGAVFFAAPAEESKYAASDSARELGWAEIQRLGREALEAYLRPTVETIEDELLLKWANNDIPDLCLVHSRLPVYIGSRREKVRFALVGKEFPKLLESEDWRALKDDPLAICTRVLNEVRKLRGKRIGHLASEAMATRASALIEIFNKLILVPPRSVEEQTFDDKLRRMLMLVMMERYHHPSWPPRQLKPLTSECDVESVSREALIQHLLPEVANILGTEHTYMKGCSEEFRQRSSNLGGQYASKVAWASNLPKFPAEGKGDAENRLHVYIGRHAGEIHDCGYGNPFVIGHNPDTYRAFYTDTASAKGGGNWPRAPACLALYLKHEQLIQDMHGTFVTCRELDDKGNWTRDNVIELFWKVTEAEHSESMRGYVDGLLGTRLGCYCQPEACHGHVLRNVFCRSVLEEMGTWELREKLRQVLHQRSRETREAKVRRPRCKEADSLEETDEEAKEPLSLAQEAALQGWLLTLKAKYEIVGTYEPT